MLRNDIYTKAIIDQHNQNISNPAIILFQLLRIYIDLATTNSSNTSTFFLDERKQNTRKLVNKLIKLNDYPETNDYVLTVIRQIYSYQMDEKNKLDGDFVELLSAYFSIYQNFHAHLPKLLYKQLTLNNATENAIYAPLNHIITQINSHTMTIIDLRDTLEYLRQMSDWMPNDTQRHAIGEFLLREFILRGNEFNFDDVFIQIKHWIPDNMRSYFIQAAFNKIENLYINHRLLKLIIGLKDWVPEKMKSQIIPQLLFKLTNNANLYPSAAFDIIAAFGDLKEWISEDQKQIIINKLFEYIYNAPAFFINHHLDVLIDKLKDWIPVADRENIMAKLLENCTSELSDDDHYHFDEKFTTRRCYIYSRDLYNFDEKFTSRRFHAYYAIIALKEFIPPNQYENYFNVLTKKLFSDRKYAEESSLICLSLAALAEVLPPDKKEEIATNLMMWSCIGGEGASNALLKMKNQLSFEYRRNIMESIKSNIDKNTPFKFQFPNRCKLMTPFYFNDKNPSYVTAFYLINAEWLPYYLLRVYADQIKQSSDIPPEIKDIFDVTLSIKVDDKSANETCAKFVSDLIKQFDARYEIDMALCSLMLVKERLSEEQHNYILLEIIKNYISVGIKLDIRPYITNNPNMGINNAIMLLGKLQALSDNMNVVCCAIMPLQKLVLDTCALNYVKEKSIKDSNFPMPQEMLNEVNRYLS